MNKKIIAIVVGLLVIIGSSAYAGASLATNTWIQMQGDIKSNTDNKINRLQSEINAKADEKPGAVKDYQSTYAKGQIEAYYADQLKALETNSLFNDAMNEIVDLTRNLITEEKARIDAAINAALGR